MPLPRSIAGVLLPAMAGLVLSTALTVAQEAASTVEALLDAGRYAEAEVEAARALDRASAADIDSASGRLLDVLLRNGRGTDTRARELAERLVSSGIDVLESYYFPYVRPISGLRNRTICVARVP